MGVDLSELTKAFAISDCRQGYVDAQEGRVVFVDSAFGNTNMGQDNEWALAIEDNMERYVPIPNEIDAHETEFMRAFAREQREETQKHLLAVLYGHGGRLKFRREAKRLFLMRKWETYLTKCLERLARDFCLENRLTINEPIK